MKTAEQDVLDIQSEIEKFNLLDKALCNAAADLIRMAIQKYGDTVSIAVCLIEAELRRDIRAKFLKPPTT